MVSVVCFCVWIQLLSMPIILLSPMDATDQLATSFIEGFALPSSLSQLMSSVESSPVTEVQVSMNMPVLFLAMFHPPVY